MPDFKNYYFAANIQNITYWLDVTVIIEKWLDIEREDSMPYSLGVIAMSCTMSKLYYGYNPVIHNPNLDTNSERV